MKNNNLINLVISFIAIFVIYNNFLKNKAEANVLTSYQELAQGKAIFIDVREEDEIKEGMIKDAMWYPLSKIQSNPNEFLKKVKEINKTTYLYCRSGNRSGKVKDILEKNDIKSINLGGYESLIKEGIPSNKGIK